MFDWSRPAFLALCAFTLWSGCANASGEVESSEVEPATGETVVLAPELDQGLAWLNTDAPIALADLRGHVVLIDFWTYGCVNCLHLLPVLHELESEFADQPFVVLGVHSGKFETEQDAASIAQAIRQYDIRHPILVDDDYATMQAFGANAWPTTVLIDPSGVIRSRRAGEFDTAFMREKVEALLLEASSEGTLSSEPLVFSVDPNAGSTTPLLFPSSVDVREDGTVVIVDSGHHRLVVFSSANPTPTTIGNGLQGHVDGTLFEATFSRPQGTAWIGDMLYVADTENHTIRRVDFAAETVTTVAGTGEKGTGRITVTDGWVDALDTALRSPWALEVVGDELIVAMAGSHQLIRFAPATGQLQVFSGSGLERLIDGPADLACYSQPSGLAMSLDGATLYVADTESSAIRAVDIATGEALTLVGTGLFDFGDVDGVGDEVLIQHPLDVEVFEDGSLVFTDTYNDKLKRLDPLTLAVETLVWSPPEQAWAEPRGLSRAGEQVFVADTNNHRILVRGLGTGMTETWSLGGLKPPQLSGVSESGP